MHAVGAIAVARLASIPTHIHLTSKAASQSSLHGNPLRQLLSEFSSSHLQGLQALDAIFEAKQQKCFARVVIVPLRLSGKSLCTLLLHRSIGTQHNQRLWLQQSLHSTEPTHLVLLNSSAQATVEWAQSHSQQWIWSSPVPVVKPSQNSLARSMGEHKGSITGEYTQTPSPIRLSMNSPPCKSGIACA